jgi:hypothetical protein
VSKNMQPKKKLIGAIPLEKKYGKTGVYSLVGL